MSLINQVLNDLESRGASFPLGEETIRAVSPRKNPHTMPYVIGAAVLLLLLAAGKWYLGRTMKAGREEPAVAVMPKIEVRPTLVPVSAAASASAVAAASTPVPAPVVIASIAAAPGISPSVRNLHGKPVLVVNSEAEPAAVPAKKQAVRPEAAQTEDRPVDGVNGMQAENAPDLQMKKISPRQKAEDEFRNAEQALQEGRTNDALAGYENALLIDPSLKDARKAWVALLISLKRNEDAEHVLEKGLLRDPHDTSLSMLMARLQVERGAVPLALETLQKTLPDAGGLADYQAFVAALLQRLDRPEEAVAHYQTALKLVPDNGVWLMGLGISLQALNRNAAARDTYQRALAAHGLNAQLRAFVQARLNTL